jgi:hypothetical protein
VGFAPGAPYQGSVLDSLETLSGPQTSRRLSSPLTQNPVALFTKIRNYSPNFFTQDYLTTIPKSFSQRLSYD